MVRGKAHCESKVYISGQRRVIKDDQYFINERMVIWESPQSDTDDNDLEKGIHEFPFSFRLPDSDMPCSLESRACSIRYHMRALLAMSETDQVPQGIKYFTIIGPLIDCNDNKYLVSNIDICSLQSNTNNFSSNVALQNPIFGAEKRWQYGFCFCYRKPIATLRSILERTAYCSGETVKLKSFIQNNSDEAVKLKVRLVQVSYIFINYLFIYINIKKMQFAIFVHNAVLRVQHTKSQSLRRYERGSTFSFRVYF